MWPWYDKTHQLVTLIRYTPSSAVWPASLHANNDELCTKKTVEPQMNMCSCNVSFGSSWLVEVLVRVSPRPGTIMFSMWPSVKTLVVALICPCFSNSFFASGDFCRLLIYFANGLDPDQDRPYVGPDLDPSRLTIWLCSWKILLKS